MKGKHKNNEKWRQPFANDAEKNSGLMLPAQCQSTAMAAKLKNKRYLLDIIAETSMIKICFNI